MASFVKRYLWVGWSPGDNRKLKWNLGWFVSNGLTGHNDLRGDCFEEISIRHRQLLLLLAETSPLARSPGKTGQTDQKVNVNMVPVGWCISIAKVQWHFVSFSHEIWCARWMIAWHFRQSHFTDRFPVERLCVFLVPIKSVITFLTAEAFVIIAALLIRFLHHRPIWPVVHLQHFNLINDS